MIESGEVVKWNNMKNGCLIGLRKIENEKSIMIHVWSGMVYLWFMGLEFW